MADRRIQRQTMIKGWDQAKVDNLLVQVYGEGLAPRYAALLCSCLEVGRVFLANEEVASEGDSFMSVGLERDYSSRRIGRVVDGFSDDTRVKGYAASFFSDFIKDMVIWGRDPFFHCGNNHAEKAHAIGSMIQRGYYDEEHEDDEKKKKQHFVFSAGNDHELRMGAFLQGVIDQGLVMPQFQGQKAGTMIGMAQASMGLGEIITHEMGLSEALEGIVTLNFCSRMRRSYVDDFSWEKFDGKGKRILVVGLGATGTSYIEAIHDRGFSKVYLVDDDTVEFTNTSRAPQFTGKVGKHKVNAVAEHFSARNKGTEYVPIVGRVAEDSEIPDVDLIVCGVDGYHNQLAIINVSQRRGIPLILGGCTPFSAVIYEYVPGVSSSMLYQYDFLREAYLSSLRKARPHCTDPAYEGSNALATTLAGALLGGETVNFFLGEYLLGYLRYDMLSNPRLYYKKLPAGRDLGKDIPVFQPLDAGRVERFVEESGERVLVDKKPFNEWYEREGRFFKL